MKKKLQSQHNQPSLQQQYSSNEAIDNADIAFHWHNGTVTL